MSHRQPAPPGWIQVKPRRRGAPSSPGNARMHPLSLHAHSQGAMDITTVWRGCVAACRRPGGAATGTGTGLGAPGSPSAASLALPTAGGGAAAGGGSGGGLPRIPGIGGAGGSIADPFTQQALEVVSERERHDDGRLGCLPPWVEGRRNPPYLTQHARARNAPAAGGPAGQGGAGGEES